MIVPAYIVSCTLSATQIYISSKCRVAGSCRHNPAPSEPDVQVTKHPAQANRSSSPSLLLPSGSSLRLPFAGTLTFPRSLTSGQGRPIGSPTPRQHPFRLSICSIRRVMISPCLSAGGLRFLEFPCPAEELGLPYGRLTGSGQIY